MELDQLDSESRQEDKFSSRDSQVWQESQRRIRNISSDYAVTSDDDILLVDGTSPVTITLPSTISLRRIVVVRVAGSSVVTIEPISPDTISGQPDVSLAHSYYPLEFKATPGNYLVSPGEVIIPTLNDLLPDQTGHTGEFLQTNGSNASWEPVVIPDPWASVRSRVYFFSGF